MHEIEPGKFIAYNQIVVVDTVKCTITMSNQFTYNKLTGDQIADLLDCWNRWNKCE